jgi:hypothetical protein
MYLPQILQNGTVIIAQSTPTPQVSSWLWYLIFVPVVACVAAILNVLLGQILPRISAWRDKRSLEKNMAGEFYTPEDIKRSRQFYIEPFVQDVDPMGGEESRALAPVMNMLFSTLDRLLSSSSDARYIFLLADSGMGKTSALMNYNIRQIRRRWKKHFEIKLIPLGIKDVIKHIEGIQNKHNTILFLDAFDEDTQAIRDHRVRLGELMSAARGFRRVLISCRTQFFPSDEEIPKEVGVLKVATRAAGEPAGYKFRKLYLSPFIESQTREYIGRRYPLRGFRWYSRRRARQMADKIPHLAARPMLLAHIDVLVRTGQTINYSFELYEEMVKAWIEREEDFISERDQLRSFSELLAVELYRNRLHRQAEHVPRQELSQLAVKWGIPVEDRQLSDYKFSTRSLLNRDADGNYKFAHRSIMEYLFVKRYTDGDLSCLQVEWTDQMHTFYWEMLEKGILTQRGLPLGNIDSNGFSPDDAQIRFLIGMAVHGLSLLRTPEIAKHRLKQILETTTALCAVIIDPSGTDDPVVSLIGVRELANNECDLDLIAVYHHGQLLNTKEAVGLKRHKHAIELIYYGDNVPNIDDEGYQQLLVLLRRESQRETSFMMPIKQNGKMVAVLVGETTRSYAFRNNHQLQILEILKLIGHYLQEYQ